MTNYREILRLSSLGFNKTQIAQSVGCSRTTVIQVLNVAEEKGVSYPLPENLSDKKLQELLFPSDRSRPGYKMPDYEYVHRELQKDGVTLNLLWLEYASIQNLSFEDRFGLLVDEEWTSRKNNHLKRLIHPARFSEPMACVEDIEYHSDRKLDPAFIARLATCDYISERHNVLLLGATGCGKTYVACALGLAAARKFLSVRYVRLPDLLSDLAIARSNGTYRKVIQQYKKPALLILDEWLLYPLKETEARDLLEIAEARYKRASTIFCSQFDVPGWRDKIGEPILADAICDRIVHDSYSIVIDCKESMRKRKGVKENPA